MFGQLAVPISDSSQIGDVRRQAQRLAREVGFSESDCGKAAIVATELATNISRDATAGEILLRSFDVIGTRGVEVLAIDRGPGMADVPRCLEDGFSTGGTAGEGLGAVRRLSSEFDVFSSRPSGTVVLARLEVPQQSSRSSRRFAWGTINLPAPREQAVGDTWRIAERQSELALLIADGLGHGPLAAEAAHTAAAAFDEDPFLPLSEYFTAADRRMRATRGRCRCGCPRQGVARSSRIRGRGKYRGHPALVRRFQGPRTAIAQRHGRGRHAQSRGHRRRVPQAGVAHHALRRAEIPLVSGRISRSSRGTRPSLPPFCTAISAAATTT